jgi:hypothetical protein
MLFHMTNIISWTTQKIHLNIFLKPGRAPPT